MNTVTDLRERLKRISNMTEEELDREIFENTSYKDMPFKRLSDWDNYDMITYASPIFEFENGDRLVVNKYGNIINVDNGVMIRLDR